MSWGDVFPVVIGVISGIVAFFIAGGVALVSGLAGYGPKRMEWMIYPTPAAVGLLAAIPLLIFGMAATVAWLAVTEVVLYAAFFVLFRHIENQNAPPQALRVRH